jgi:hypothetical protein
MNIIKDLNIMEISEKTISYCNISYGNKIFQKKMLKKIQKGTLIKEDDRVI